MSLGLSQVPIMASVSRKRQNTDGDMDLNPVAMAAQLADLQSKVVVMETDFRSRMAAMETDHHLLRERVKYLEGELKKRDEVVEQNVEKMVNTYAEKLKCGLAEAQPKSTTQEVLREVAVMQVVMQEKKLNVIFRGVDESDSDLAATRKEFDKQVVLNITSAIGVEEDVMEAAMVTTRRIGKHQEGRNRPLLVRLNNQELREKLCRKHRELKELNVKNKGTMYKIDPDLTREQLANLDAKWDEARKLSKNGVTWYVSGKEHPVLKRSWQTPVAEPMATAT